MPSSWLDRMLREAKPEELPVLAVTGRAVARGVENPQAPLRSLIAAVMADPALSLRVLQRANAIPHRHFRFELSSLEDAAQMLGTRMLVRMAAEAPVAQGALDGQRAEAYLRAAGRAVLAAGLARDWAEVDRDRFPAEIGLAALLNNLGELFLLARGDPRMNRYLELVEQCFVYPHEAEYVALGESLEVLGYRLAEQWRLPEVARESMQGRNARHLRTLSVMLAAQIARYALSGWRHPMQLGDLRLVAEMLDLDIAALRDRVNRVLRDFNHRAGDYCLAQLPMLPGGSDDRWLADLDLPRSAQLCLAPRADDYQRALERLEGHADSGRAAVLDTLLRGLHRGLGLNRAVVAQLESRTRRLSAERLIGTDFEPRFNRFSLSLQEAGLFAELLETGGSLWLEDRGRDALSERIPRSIQDLIGVDGFFVAALSAGTGPRALVYADRRSRSCRLDAKCYDGFLTLVRQAEVRLAALSRDAGR